MGSHVQRHFNVKRIAIVGAGPTGLAAARYLVAQEAFETIDIFEEQFEVGGVWNYSKNPSPTLHVPQVSAHTEPDPPLRPEDTPPIFPSPMYQLLHTNIPRNLMRFSDLAFPQDSLIYPSRELVQEYLVTYAKDLRYLIKFSRQVQDVRLRETEGNDQWDVDTLSVETGEITTAAYDAVVVASGHYALTYLPDLKNIGEFHKAHPGVVSHAKLYRTPEAFASKKVVVVGNAASGLDIAAQISRVCQKPLLLSVRTATPPESLAFADAEEVPVIDEFLVSERGIKFQDGRIEKDIDAVIFATGYLFTFPFLTSLKPPRVTNGRRVFGLYQDLFDIDHPTLVFPGLPIKVVPFSLAESQAAIFSRTWANLLRLPSTAAMRSWEEEEAKKRGSAFHVWPKGGDAEYINTVHKLILQSGGPGKTPPYWNGELAWERKICFDAKLKFEIEGRKAKSLEELGFKYEPGQETSSSLGII
ncbi:hypothetical protein B0H67DRAFT_483504 [Lasiosphaeris hirsuta]|uniref:Thiol-specific monooxygenase n=1 Tax=Lasiosphaeris hirsuta TaxID=260670 RepID=A0AA40E0S2_9PEZI|nr:hypothetical protein B0H67DRAFT_483504 [Lasiosphaeris hirsuta]